MVQAWKGRVAVITIPLFVIRSSNICQLKILQLFFQFYWCHSGWYRLLPLIVWNYSTFTFIVSNLDYGCWASFGLAATTLVAITVRSIVKPTLACVIAAVGLDATMHLAVFLKFLWLFWDKPLLLQVDVKAMAFAASKTFLCHAATAQFNQPSQSPSKWSTTSSFS